MEIERFLTTREGRMTLNRLTAITLVGFLALSAPTLANAFTAAGPQLVQAHQQFNEVRDVQYRRAPFPANLAAGVIGGIVGGALGNGCYFNDCGYGYDDGYYYGNGGYYGGNYGGGYVGGHGRGGGHYNRGGGGHSNRGGGGGHRYISHK
jgi:hypothetical protein